MKDEPSFAIRTSTALAQVTSRRVFVRRTLEGAFALAASTAGQHRLRGAGEGGDLRAVAVLLLLRRHHQDLRLGDELHHQELRHLPLRDPQQLLVGEEQERGLAVLRLLLPSLQGLRRQLVEVLLRRELHHELQALRVPVPVLLMGDPTVTVAVVATAALAALASTASG
jgi:hypothetical protein